MTTLTKIEVKIVQFMLLCTFILVSKHWFSWLLKIPAFILLVCGWVITRPYEWIYVWLYKRCYGKDNDVLDIAHKMVDIASTERFENMIGIFI